MRMRTRAGLLNFFHFSNEYLVSKGKREELKQSRPLREGELAGGGTVKPLDGIPARARKCRI